MSGEPFAERADLILETLRNRDLLSPGGSGKLPYGLAVARLAEDPADAEALTYVAEGGMGGEPPFNGLYMIRGYLTARENFSASQEASIRAFGEAVEDWNLDYTENHKVLLWSIAYLMAQSFPEGTWNWEDRQVDSTTLLRLVRETVIEYGQAVFDRGYSDLLSPTYDAYKTAAWANLYDFAENPDVRAMADAMLTYHLTLLALGSRGEVILPPYSRGSGALLDSELGSESQWLHWLFWGQGGTNAATDVNQSSPEWIIALTSWRPPETVNQIAINPVDEPYTFLTQQPFFFLGDPMYLSRMTYHDRTYSVSSGVYRMDMESLDVHGAREVVDDDPFAIAWDSAAPLRYLSVRHPYWDSDAGENSWSKRSSPFLQVVQSRNTAIIGVDVPVTDPWADVVPWSGTRADELIPLAQIRYPIAGVTFDDSWGDDWFSLDTGGTYIAVKVLQPGWSRNRRAIQSLGFHLIESRGTSGERWQTGFLFEAVNADTFADLSGFMDAVMSNPLQIDLENGTVVYTSTLGDVLEMQFNDSLNVPDFSVPEFSVNGEPVDYSAWPHLASPWTNLEEGILELATDNADEVEVVDWSGAVPIQEVREVTNEEPTTWAGYPVGEDGWVDTGDFLGWVAPHSEGYIFSLLFDKFIFIPESGVGTDGGWAYIPVD